MLKNCVAALTFPNSINLDIFLVWVSAATANDKVNHLTYCSYILQRNQTSAIMVAQTGPKEQAFFSEEATRQILTRIANVFNDTDFIVLP